MSSTLDWKTDAGTLTVIPAYRHGALDFTSAAAGFLIQQEETDKQGSIEARFASNANQPFTYLGGFYYLNEKINVGNATYDQQYNASAQQYDPSTESYAVFGRIGYAIADSFRLDAGARFTDDHKSFDGTLNAASTICPGAFYRATLWTTVLLRRRGSSDDTFLAHRPAHERLRDGPRGGVGVETTLSSAWFRCRRLVVELGLEV